MITHGRALKTLGGFLVGLALAGGAARFAAAADTPAPNQAQPANAALAISNDQLVVAEARLAELKKRLLDKQREVVLFTSQAERTRSTVNAYKEQEAKVYRSAAELFAGLPPEAQPVAGLNGSIERAATRKWLKDRFGSQKNLLEWEATVQKVEDSGAGSFSVVITTDTPVSQELVLGKQTCQLKISAFNFGTGSYLNEASQVIFSKCTADEVKQLRALKGQKVAFRGTLQKVDVLSRTPPTKPGDDAAPPYIEISLPLNEVTINGFQPQASKRPSASAVAAMTKEKLLVAEARLADLELLIVQKAKELSGLEQETEVQRKLIATAQKPEAKVFRSAEELLAGMPKEVYPVAGPNSSIERDATRKWLMEKIGNRQSVIEWEATIKNVEDLGEDPFTVLIALDLVPFQEQLIIGGVTCKISVAEPRDEYHGSFKPTMAYINCTAEEVRMLRELKGKKVALRGLIDYVDVGSGKAKNEIIFALHMREISVNGFLPAANDKQSGRLRN